MTPSAGTTPTGLIRKPISYAALAGGGSRSCAAEPGCWATEPQACYEACACKRKVSSPRADVAGNHPHSKDSHIRRKPMTRAITAATTAMLLALGVSAKAAEIKVLSSNGLKSVLEELAPQFEKASGHKLMIVWGAAVPLRGQIEKGEVFDATILTTAAIDALIGQAKLDKATRTPLARSSVGVAVRKGAPKPDISTTEAFKTALRNAKSIAYVEQGASGIYLKELFVRLGIADELKAKIKLAPTNAAEFVANGEAEIGMTQISEILPFAGADLGSEERRVGKECR